ncbi:hypothetical protein BGZ54_008180 [Gamsiella multidivaricata]|nr:hypothetical protein BGZ54_008180 [Gamsiella multidivaricata]
MTPPSAPSSVADTTVMDDESALAAIPKAVDEQALDKDVSQRELASIDAVGSSSDANKTPAARSRMTKGTHRSAAHGDIQSSYSEPSLAKLALSNNINGGVGKDTRRSHMPLQEQGSQQKAAEALVARLDMFAHSINGIGDEAAKINYLKDVTLKHGPTGAHNGTPSSTHPTGPSRAQQLKRLLSTSPVHNEDIQGTSPPDRASRDVGASRLGHISGWTHWRDRHNSNSGKQIERATSDQGDIPVDCSKAVQPYYNGGFKGDQEAWRQSFGLFWVAAGHWLDDSRTINSYSFKPQDLLELQLRNHYIQLPPPDGNLTYYDHYAEGILFKLSKKNRPVSMFTNHGSRESQGVWKERWVVLQGSKLLIYHKRKDTTKKTIDLPTPLHIITRTLPRNPRQFFKVTSSSTATMSSTMITLDVSPDPMVPKLCFRGISENEVNHWTRIFNSLNNNAAPLSSPLVAQGGFGSPNLGSLESMPGRSMDSSNSLASSLGGYSSERKRNHTTNNTFHNTVASTMPSIDPVLISNAAAAISNLNSMTNSNHPTTINGHRRNISQTTNLSGSMLNNRDMNLLQNHPLTTSTKEDIRRRAITEPNRFRLISMQPPAQRGHAKHGSKVSAPELDTSQAMDVSNVSDVPFMLDSPPGRKKRPVLGTEYLDNASQVLMATSSARSSTAPLYSGYIWMYMPNVIDTREDEAISKRTEKQPTASSFNDESIAIPTTTSSPSTSGSRTVSSNTNKASGRYVKCFAVISDQGHFQWVEVKKQNDLETEQELKARLKGSTSRSSYGIQLTAPKTGELDRDTDGCSIPEESSERLTGISSTEPSRCDTGLIQASVAHKLRLFFFCIKIPPSVLTEVLLNTAEATPRAPSIAATATATNAAAKAVNKIRHRLSSSLSNFTTSALPPLPNTKSQSLTGSISKGKNMTWPNMASSHDKEVFTQNHQQQQALHPEKAMTVPGGSIGSVLHKASSVSLKSTPPNITTVPSVALTLMLQGKDGESIQFASPTSAEPTSPVSPTSSSNNVLFLAQSLQKAVLLNRQHSVTNDEYSDSGSSSSENTTTQSTQSSPLGSSKARLTLSKAMAANQTALPDSAAMLEQSKLLQEQLETQNRHQRTEDRSRTRHQQEHHTHLQDSSGVYVDVNSSASINSVCPFMELSENVDGSDEAFVMLKGYTETEEGWKALQYALEKSLDGLIGEQTSALPPEDTLIPSYHSPPEVQLSEKAQRFLDAKESLIEEANLAASKAAVEAARCSTPDMVSGGSIVPSNGAVAQIRATSVSLTRWMNLTGGGEKDREKSKVRLPR